MTLLPNYVVLTVDNGPVHHHWNGRNYADTDNGRALLYSELAQAELRDVEFVTVDIRRQTRGIRKAIERFGLAKCLEAARSCDTWGNGASTIAWEVLGCGDLRGGVQLSNSAICAGRFILEQATTRLEK